MHGILGEKDAEAAAAAVAAAAAAGPNNQPSPDGSAGNYPVAANATAAAAAAAAAATGGAAQLCPDVHQTPTPLHGQLMGYEVSRVGIRVPPFYPDNPAVWFGIIEGQFHVNNITRELTKFYHAISQLDPKTAAEVEEIITCPPALDPYTKLKHVLISRFSESCEEKIHRLLEKEEIGSRRPSSFLRHLRTLAKGAGSDQMIKTIWIGRLPTYIQGNLICQPPSMSLDDLGDLADKLYGITPNNHHLVQQVHMPAQCNHFASTRFNNANPTSAGNTTPTTEYPHSGVNHIAATHNQSSSSAFPLNHNQPFDMQNMQMQINELTRMFSALTRTQ
jgi:hypothetical protein